MMYTSPVTVADSTQVPRLDGASQLACKPGAKAANCSCICMAAAVQALDGATQAVNTPAHQPNMPREQPWLALLQPTWRLRTTKLRQLPSRALSISATGNLTCRKQLSIFSQCKIDLSSSTAALSQAFTTHTQPYQADCPGWHFHVDSSAVVLPAAEGLLCWYQLPAGTAQSPPCYAGSCEAGIWPPVAW